MSEGAREEQQAEKVIEDARKAMRAAAGDLTSIRYRLLGVHASIPPASQETSKEDLEGEIVVETELRTVIAIGIRDCLDPLINDIATAAEYRLGPAVADSAHREV